MSKAEKMEYDLFTDYKPENYQMSWENYKITGFRTVAEYNAYLDAREHEQNVCFEFLKNWKIGETNSAFGAEIQKKIDSYKEALRSAIEIALTTAPSRSAEHYNNGLTKELSLLDSVTPKE